MGGRVDVWPSRPSTAGPIGGGGPRGQARTAAAAHPAGSLAAAVSLDSFIRVFDVDTGAFVATLEVPPSEVWGVQFHTKVSALLFPP